MTGTKFPEGFSWGVSTSSYQIEGAVNVGGRGSSIWDTFSHTPGKVFHGDTGDIACDHFHRLDEDLDLLARLGVDVYRFSIAWPRVQPQGTGVANEEGLAFYDRVVDGLIQRGIKPVPTLYHWDLPQPLQDIGGWANRAIVDAFADYAAKLARHFAGRVPMWTTINEPWVIAYLGYALGLHAPGISDPAQAAAAHHHLLLAHAAGMAAIRSADPAAQVGIALNMSHIYPWSDHAEDVHAAALADMQLNASFLNPLVHGAYPADMGQLHERWQDGVLVQDGDLARIAAPLDFLSINTYHPRYVCDPANSREARAQGWTGGFAAPFSLGLPFTDVEPPGCAKTDMGWMIEPAGLTDLLLRLAADAPGLALYISENGASCADYPDPAGKVSDPERVAYLDGHLRAALMASGKGVKLRGYWAWSFMDNFEWGFGYSKRFGLVYIDYPSGKRTPKQSFDWYHDVIANNALP
ncbi:MAG: family 1 glycosylhydrolase [Gammaproteobacteria bacterium]|nr:family 1 glycosylhydrolase [Gammaproteobacteria bacterium]MCP5146441.1 family 1 glycosylhydrolase [Gammaproteobacteria bacterium]